MHIICSASKSDGSLNNCHNNTSPAFVYAEQLTVKGSYLYVAASYYGGYYGDGQLYRCPINPDTGDLYGENQNTPESAGCVASNNPNGEPWYPSQVSFNPFN